VTPFEVGFSDEIALLSSRLIGTLANKGGGKFSGQFRWSVDR